jgi:transcriptional regulator with XRE-family HTH domain
MADLEAWMKARGETDESLAPKLGLSRVQVSRIRRRICNPSPAVATKLESLTEIPAIDLLLRERVA